MRALALVVAMMMAGCGGAEVAPIPDLPEVTDAGPADAGLDCAACIRNADMSFSRGGSALPWQVCPAVCFSDAGDAGAGPASSCDGGASNDVDGGTCLVIL